MAMENNGDSHNLLISTATKTKTDSIALTSLMVIGIGGILAMAISTGNALARAFGGGKVIPIQVLNIDLDKVVLGPDELPSKFEIQQIAHNDFDGLSLNAGVDPAKEAIEEVVQSINYREDLVHYVTSIRLYDTVVEAQTVFNSISNGHGRNVNRLKNNEIMGDETFCHTVIKEEENNYFICGFRWMNVYVHTQATIPKQNYKFAHTHLNAFWEKIRNYDDSVVPQHPMVDIQTPGEGELLTRGDYLITWDQMNVEDVIIYYVSDCSGCGSGILHHSAIDGINPGDIIKSENNHTIYYIGADNKRYVFPNKSVYQSWFDNFSNVKKVHWERIPLIPVGGTVTYKPGTKLVRIKSDPQLYAVDSNATLRPLRSVKVIKEIFGSKWKSLVEIIPDNFFTSYTVGSGINVASDYDRDAILLATKSIDAEKGIGHLVSKPGESVSKSFLWHMPPDLPAGDEYFIKIEGYREDYGFVADYSGKFIVVARYNY